MSEHGGVAPPGPTSDREQRAGSDHVGAALSAALAVLLLGVVAHYLTEHVPEWASGTSLARPAAAVEYPVYAIALGLLGNVALTATGLRDRLAGGLRTEFLIKTGLVLLGASINLKVIVSAAGPAVAQALLLISIVFGFTWWFAGRLGLDDRLRALLASAVSICGVSAAIAAAGSVHARKEQLAYAASLVIAFALPSIFLLPWAADVLGLPDPVAGAWIGGNIDTTAAVTAAGAIAGEGPLAIASIVKVTQNALIGFVALGLAAWFAYRVDRTPDAARPRAVELWHRFPKFVLGFVLASVIATLYLQGVPAAEGKAAIAVVNDLRTWFLLLAFVSIGLEFRVAPVREAGWRPVGVFAAATAVNLAAGLALASWLFTGFVMPT